MSLLILSNLTSHYHTLAKNIEQRVIKHVDQHTQVIEALILGCAAMANNQRVEHCLHIGRGELLILIAECHLRADV